MAGRVICSFWQVLFIMSFMWGWYCCMGEQATATFYTSPYVPSPCFGNDLSQFPAGNLFVAASDAFWEDGAACGRQYSVSCTGATNDGVPMPCKSGSVVVKIVDLCPAGCRGTIDLSQEAFAQIAVPDAGKVFVNFEQL